MPIFAFVTDLFFKSKIDATAKALGKTVEFSSDVYASKKGDLILVDLEEFGLEGIQKLREQNPQTKIIGFLSHKRGDLIPRAKMIPELRVMPRSEFAKKLEQLLSE
jgi:DNA-binding NarL/FixJ family response regulator